MTKVEVVQMYLTSEEAEALKLMKKYGLRLDKRIVYVVSILERIKKDDMELMG